MKEGKARRSRHGIGHWKISTQLVLVYFCAIFIPMVALGTFMISTIRNTQESYYEDLLEAYNEGLKQTIYEITTQIMTISDSIVYNDNLIDFLNGEYETPQQIQQAVADTTLLDKYVSKYVGVEQICIYIDRDDMINCGQFYKVTDEIRQSDWYRKAGEQYLPFWMAYESETERGSNLKWNLILVRKMILVGGNREAVIMIKVRDSYLASRLSNTRYTTMMCVDDQTAAFTNYSALYGTRPDIDIPYGEENFSYMGVTRFDDTDSLVSVNTLNLNKSPNHLYLISYDTEALAGIQRIVRICVLVMAVAIILPLIVMIAFSSHFVNQVRSLREEMGKASRGEYDDMKTELGGSEELGEAFSDLLNMVSDIQRMEAEQYETQIREQRIKNDQQKIEFKMLSNQINPHFLYNTLETIRMKALTAGDIEAANATKLLGKSMRYVLENTGMHDTTLQREIDHVMTYLQIQKLRFGDRVNWQMNIQPELIPEKYRIIPLILQPIVENAIVHGLEARESDGKVWIAIYQIDGVLYIDISDNGLGMTAEELEELRISITGSDGEMKTSSIGLNNIHRRLRLNYGEQYGLTILSTKGEGTRVTVNMPALGPKIKNAD